MGSLCLPATSLLLHVAYNQCHQISATNRANAWVGVHRSISVLSTLGQISSLAGQLQKRLEQIMQACVTNELFPLSSEGLTHGHQKREAPEMPELFGGASGLLGRQEERPSIRRQDTESGEFPDSISSLFLIGCSPSSIEEGSPGSTEESSSGLPYLGNPWLRFDASLFHHSGKPMSSPIDGNLDPSAWMPPYPPSEPPLDGPSRNFSYDNFDLGHSFIV